MLYLTSDDIKKVCTMRDAIESDREAFLIQNEGGAELPTRTNFHVTANSITSFMPAFLKGPRQAGIKIVSTYPDNMKLNKPSISATVILTSPESGEVCAIMDGTELTRMRTGGVSGLASELLSNPDAKIAALFGTGGQSLSQMEAVLSVRKIEEYRIYDQSAERMNDFVERASALAERYGVKLIAAKSSEAAASDADIITTVTTSAVPVFDGNCVKDGVHINAVGVFLPEKRELDEVVLHRASRIFVDNKEAVLAEAGDFLIPHKAGRFSLSSIDGELGALANGDLKGRASASEITIMKTVGFATLDIVFASKIYEKAAAAGIGLEL